MFLLNPFFIQGQTVRDSAESHINHKDVG